MLKISSKNFKGRKEISERCYQYALNPYIFSFNAIIYNVVILNISLQQHRYKTSVILAKTSTENLAHIAYIVNPRKPICFKYYALKRGQF